MFRLTNVPTAASGSEMYAKVEGESITLYAGKKGQGWSMCDCYIGGHMLERPQELREMIAREMLSLIAMARDVGYRQAKAEIRSVLGVE